MNGWSVFWMKERESEGQPMVLVEMVRGLGDRAMAIKWPPGERLGGRGLLRPPVQGRRPRDGAARRRHPGRGLRHGEGLR